MRITAFHDFSVLHDSSSWGGSLKSGGSIKSESSMHGLLTDEQEADDNIELLAMRNAKGVGVDVSFQGLYTLQFAPNSFTYRSVSSEGPTLLSLQLQLSVEVFISYNDVSFFAGVTFHYPEQPPEKVCYVTLCFAFSRNV
jgi:hypothetical protein